MEAPSRKLTLPVQQPPQLSDPSKPSASRAKAAFGGVHPVQPLLPGAVAVASESGTAGVCECAPEACRYHAGGAFCKASLELRLCA